MMNNLPQNYLNKTSIETNCDEENCVASDDSSCDASTCTNVVSISEQPYYPIHQHQTRAILETKSSIEKNSTHRRIKSTPKDMRSIHHHGRPALLPSFESSGATNTSSPARVQHVQRRPSSDASQTSRASSSTDSTTRTVGTSLSSSSSKASTSSVRTNPTHFMRGMLIELQQAGQCRSSLERGPQPSSSTTKASSPTVPNTNSIDLMRGVLSDLQSDRFQARDYSNHRPLPTTYNRLEAPFASPIDTTMMPMPAGGEERRNDYNFSFLSLLNTNIRQSDASTAYFTATDNTSTSTTATLLSSRTRTPPQSSRNFRSHGDGRILPFSSTTTNRDTTRRKRDSADTNASSRIMDDSETESTMLRRKRIRSHNNNFTSLDNNNPGGYEEELVSRAGKALEIKETVASSSLLVVAPATAKSSITMVDFRKSTSAVVLDEKTEASFVSEITSSGDSKVTATTHKLSTSSSSAELLYGGESDQSNTPITNAHASVSLVDSKGTVLPKEKEKEVDIYDHNAMASKNVGRHHRQDYGGSHDKKAGKSLFSRKSTGSVKHMQTL